MNISLRETIIKRNFANQLPRIIIATRDIKPISKPKELNIEKKNGSGKITNKKKL